jgi:hypothetical protein
MQRIKITLFTFLTLVCFVGCSVYGDKRQIDYPVGNIVELNEQGKQIYSYKPVKGSIYIYIDFDVVEFVDSDTNKKKQIINSYKFTK